MDSSSPSLFLIALVYICSPIDYPNTIVDAFKQGKSDQDEVQEGGKDQVVRAQTKEASRL